MRDLVSVTIGINDKDIQRLHSYENYEKLEMCAQALELSNSISLALSGITGTEHKIFVDEERMQVSLVYSAPDLSDERTREFVETYRSDKERLYSSFQESKKEFAKLGIEIMVKKTSIDATKLMP